MQIIENVILQDHEYRAVLVNALGNYLFESDPEDSSVICELAFKLGIEREVWGAREDARIDYEIAQEDRAELEQSARERQR